MFPIENFRVPGAKLLFWNPLVILIEVEVHSHPAESSKPDVNVQEEEVSTREISEGK